MSCASSLLIKTEKEIQKKRNIKSRKINKRKRKMFMFKAFHNMVFLEPHLNLTFLLASLSYSSSSDTYHNLPHIFLHPLLLLATNNSSSLILLFSTFLHVQLPVCHGITELSLLLTFHSLVHIISSLSALTLSLSATLLLTVSLSLPSLFILLL